MKCKKCNTEMPKGNKVCTSCGEKIKKPIYKKIWFWVLIVVIIGAIGRLGDSVDTPNTPNLSTPAPSQAVEKDTPSESKAPEVIETPKEEAYVNTAESTELFSGDFSVGTDVKAGRYLITCGSGSGNFFVYNGDMPYINEILTHSLDDSMGMGVTQIEVDLSDGQVIKVSGLDDVNLAPAIIEQKTTLGAGYHIVGRDVPEGSYIATAPNGSGNFFVYGKSGLPKTNEILGSNDFGLGVEKVKVSLNKGDTVQISGLETVVLE